eukprot:6983003-Alexandrium_andersonii.AAC.1
MSASLVGSEMCIRDRIFFAQTIRRLIATPLLAARFCAPLPARALSSGNRGGIPEVGSGPRPLAPSAPSKA